MSATQFETRSCTRCGGSGRYSFNQFDGDRCFGCAGKGRMLTTRGLAASAWLKALRQVPASDVKPGDIVRHDMLAGLSPVQVTSKVISVGPSTVSVTTVIGDCKRQADLVEITVDNARFGRCGMHLGAQAPVQLVFDAATKAEQFARALAYQATLDERGEPLAAAA